MQINYEKEDSERKFQNKVERLLEWIQDTYVIDISQLMEPHFLLG